MISLLNYKKKLVGKVIVENFLCFYEINLKLYIGQIETCKSRCAIDVTTNMIDNAYKIWEKKNIRASLLMDVIETFDYISRVKLAQWMRWLEINNDLIG